MKTIAIAASSLLLSACVTLGTQKEVDSQASTPVATQTPEPLVGVESKKDLAVSAATVGANSAAGSPTLGTEALTQNPSAFAEKYELSQTLEFGEEGSRRLVLMARNKTQAPHLFVFVQKNAAWLKTAEKVLEGNLKGLTFGGTRTKTAADAAVTCLVDGSPKVVFGYMKKGKKPLFTAANRKLVWTLDDALQPVAVAGKKIACNI